MTDFGAEFIRSRGKPVVYKDVTVFHTLRVGVEAETCCQIRWRTAVHNPPQGIRLKSPTGHLLVNGETASRFVLWRENSPETIDVVCGKEPGQLLIWNCWRDERGTTHAWTGNCGMKVSLPAQDTFRVECNSRHAITFADLVFDIWFSKPTRAPEVTSVIK